MLTFTQEQIKEISEQLDCGFRAFYHKVTGDLIFVPDADRLINIDMDGWRDDLDKLDENPSDYNQIDAMEASDSFRVMADFAEQLTDSGLRDKLVNALNKPNPFSKFKFVIDNSGEHRQNWFDFKNKRYIEWTEEQLKIQNELE
jgi:hypothetical protein